MQKHPTQTKLAIHILGVSILVQATFGNFYISPAVSIPLGSACILLTAGATCRFLLSHLKELSELPIAKKISCFACPVLLGAAQGAGMWLGDVQSRVSKAAFFAINLGAADLSTVITLSIHACFLNKCSPYSSGRSSSKKTNGNGQSQSVDSIEKKELHPLEAEAYQKCHQLEAEIKELQFKKKQVDDFIASHEELKEKCLKVIKEESDTIAWYVPPKTQHLDPNNILDRKALLLHKKNALEHELNERKWLIEGNPELLKCFKEIIGKYKEKKLTETLPLLTNV